MIREGSFFAPGLEVTALWTCFGANNSRVSADSNFFPLSLEKTWWAALRLAPLRIFSWLRVSQRDTSYCGEHLGF
jgi:hypothetical protein